METVLMRILVVTQYFWPENFRINDLCSELVKRGYDITVLTGCPNYPTGVFFDDFLKSPMNYTMFNGVNIIRVPLIARGQGSYIRLMVNYLSFMITASTIGLFKLRKNKFDIVFVCQLSPITSSIPALVYKKINRVPVVMWVLDLWPDSLIAVRAVKSKLLLRLIGNLARFIYRRCDLILGQSKSFQKEIMRYCKAGQKVEYFPSWAEQDFTAQVPVSEHALSHDNDAFKILFAGNIGEAQDFPAILKSFLQLKAVKTKVRLYVAGDGRALNWVKERVAQLGLEDFVIFLGQLPLEKMPALYIFADALLVSLKDEPTFFKTIPGKLQSYLASGKPVLTMLSGEGSKVVNDARCGYVADAGDSEQLTKNILSMSELTEKELEKLGKNAKRYADLEFNREMLISKLEGYFSSLVKLNNEK